MTTPLCADCGAQGSIPRDPEGKPFFCCPNCGPFASSRETTAPPDLTALVDALMAHVCLAGITPAAKPHRDALLSFVSSALARARREGLREFVDEVAPEHGRTSCTDKDSNGNEFFNEYGIPRCVRCALLYRVIHGAWMYGATFRVAELRTPDGVELREGTRMKPLRETDHG